MIPRTTLAATLLALGTATSLALPASAHSDPGVPAAVQRILAEDDSAHLDAGDQLFYVDPLPAAASATTRTSDPDLATTPAAYDLSQTFLLHSRAGSAHTVYLDFDGATVSGTFWNSRNGLPAGAYAGYSLDASAAFSDTEKSDIQSIWQRVSEDYAPFDVDVTTQPPAAGALTRTSSTDPTYGTTALVNGGTAASGPLCASSCGGVSYVGVIAKVGGEQAQPAWVFSSLLGDDTKSIAEAVSHEVGHTFGLHHDGIGDQDYYAPAGTWAPIMGAGYEAPLSQWSRGEYAGATDTEDDLAIIAAAAPVVADDAGDSPASATTTLSGAGVGALISTRADRDVFALPTCAQTTTVTATPAGSPSPDLDLSVDLLDAAGSVLATADPPVRRDSDDAASGLGATASAAVSGPAYARVDGVGSGDPLGTGYSDYASLGRYTISATCGAAPPVVAPVVPTVPVTAPVVVPSAAPVPGAPRITRAASGHRGGRRTAVLRWAGPSGAPAVTGYRVLVLVRGVSAVAATLGPRASSYTFRSRTGGAYRFAVVALGAAGVGATSAPSRRVRVR